MIMEMQKLDPCPAFYVVDMAGCSGFNIVLTGLEELRCLLLDKTSQF